MNLNQEHIAGIREGIKNLQDFSDLTALINYVYGIVYPDSKIRIRLNQLIYYADRKNAAQRYKVFKIAKKNGGTREIKAPVNSLKRIQRAINLILASMFESENGATGFIKGKNLLDNARPHVGKYYVYNLDLENFFPSITYNRVVAILRIYPYYFPEKIAVLVANLCCDEGKLPQGAPTSPIFSNLVCRRLDKKLTGLARRFRASYTRYADDLTFSAYSNVFSEKGKFTEKLTNIVIGQGFLINPAKTRIQGAGYRQVVTGLVVNQKPNLERKKMRIIRSILHNWERHGYSKAHEFFKTGCSRLNDKQVDMFSYLDGMLNFVRMVRGQDDLIYMKFREKFRELIFRDHTDRQSLIEYTLFRWQHQGEKKARAYFNMRFSGKNYKPARLKIKAIGPIRINALGNKQQWIKLEDIINKKTAEIILFDNKFELLDPGKIDELKGKICYGEIFTVSRHFPIINSSISDNDEEQILEFGYNLPLLWDKDKSFLEIFREALVQQFKLNFYKKSNLIDPSKDKKSD